MITFKWSIVSLERTLPSGLVTAIHYDCTAISPDGLYSSVIRGAVGLDPADPDNFIEYEDLTPELCLSWLAEKMGEEDQLSIETAVEQQLKLQIEPVVAHGVPWALPYLGDQPTE